MKIVVEAQFDDKAMVSLQDAGYFFRDVSKMMFENFGGHIAKKLYAETEAEGKLHPKYGALIAEGSYSGVLADGAHFRIAIVDDDVASDFAPNPIAIEYTDKA